MGRDRTQWTALRGPIYLATLMALVCDLQSMLHKTLPHLTVITNKHHAQSLRLLFCLLAQVAGSSLCGPSLKEAKYPGLLSLTEDPLSGKGKRRAGEETIPRHDHSHASWPGVWKETFSSIERTCSGRWRRGLISLTLSLHQAQVVAT